ncbi:MAG: GxxExxY protein [Gemmatimonadota bacterium]|nr:GxxExxY protein [Gemmatimonadota bacterium]
MVRTPLGVREHVDVLAERVMGAAIEVHRHLGPGLVESVYLAAMEHELLARGIAYESDVHLPLWYKGATLDGTLHMDLIIEREVAVALKSLDIVLPMHCAPLLTYLKVGDYRRGLLINFNVATLMSGVRRFSR